MADRPLTLRCIPCPCVTTVGMVGQSFSSAAHRAADAASMGALHSMRARAASSPTRPWRCRSAMTSCWTGR
eukprot:2483504-Prymnesium_polylepis.1